MMIAQQESPSSSFYNLTPARAMGHDGLPKGLVRRSRAEAP
jgi:hypothetical protein